MRRSSRGNPWHDSRGRFCSGPQNGGVMSSHEITKVELSPGDSMKLTTQTSENPLFERNSEELKHRAGVYNEIVFASQKRDHIAVESIMR